MEQLIEMSWVIECQKISDEARKQIDTLHQQQTILLKQQHEKDIAIISHQKLKFQQQLARLNSFMVEQEKHFSAQIKEIEIEEMLIEQHNLEKLGELKRERESMNSQVECQRQNYIKLNKIDVIKEQNNSQQVKISEGLEIYQYKAAQSLRRERIRIRNIGLQYKESYAFLAMNISSEIKKYKSNLQKAINIPLNARSSLSASHLMDKFKRLKTLLQGFTVNVQYNPCVCAMDHPQALALCKDLLAEKFIKQGYEIISYNYKAAFPIATVITGLWAEIPDFGDLFLSNLYNACPYILSYDEKNQSLEALGYDMEKQDEFLKRMSGLARLYFSVICSPMQQVFDKPHPHGIENGWKWLNRTLNLEPISNVTPTILYDFLDTAGFAMQQAYGIRFDKLLTVLRESYLPEMRQVTQIGCYRPIIRLENLLKKYMKQGKIRPPLGLLGDDFLDV